MTEKIKQDPVANSTASNLSNLYPGIGFFLNLLLDPAVGKSQLQYDACELFKASALYSDLPPYLAHDLGILSRLNEAQSVLIGHPIPLSLGKQIELVKLFVGCWFGIVDKLSGDSPVRGVASVAYGQIDFIPDSRSGHIRGDAYNDGFKAFGETISPFQTWKSTGSHRLAVNKAALKHLKLPPSTETYQGFECNACILYGLDWSEDLIP